MRKWVDGEYYKDYKKGKKASKPRIDFLPFPTHVYHDFLSYYGAQLQYLGAFFRVKQAMSVPVYVCPTTFDPTTAPSCSALARDQV